MKKMRNSVKCLIAFFAMATAFCVTGITAQAAVTVQQIDASEGSVKIQWTQQSGAKYYGWQIATDNSFKSIVASGTTTSSTTYITKSSLAAGTTYYARVGYGSTNKNCNTNWSNVIDAVTAPTGLTEVKFVGADDTTATIAYNACAGATGYDIEYNKAIIGSTADTTYRVPIVDGASSWVKVYPYRVSSTGFKATGNYKYCYDLSRLTTTIAKDNFGVTSALTNINVFYFAALGYGKGVDMELTPVSGKGNVINVTGSLNSSSSIRVANLTKGTMYKYRVRAYVVTSDSQKVYGNWSDYRYLINTKDNKYTSSNRKIKLKWGKLKGVSKIKVQIATSENGKYKTCKVLSGKKTNYTITKCGKSSLKKGKKYWVKVTYTTKGGTSDVYGYISGLKIR